MAWSFDSPGISATVFLDREPPPPGLVELAPERGGLVRLRFRDGRALMQVETTGDQGGPSHE